MFEQPLGGGNYGPLMLPQIKNVEYSINFTHLMNYLCLLEEKLLCKLVGQAKDAKIRELFGYTDPDKGISFLTDYDGDEKPGKPEQIWKYAYWYSIICSLMLQYPNVCGDLSYILHDRQIFPLLKQTLQHPVLRERVLFGTDFYVVHNHKSEKNMAADIMAGLSEEEFDLIAWENPVAFLRNSLHGHGKVAGL